MSNEPTTLRIMKSLKITLFTLFLAAFGLVGCDIGSALTDAMSEGVGDTPVSLSFSMVDNSTFGTTALSSDASALSKSGAIELTRVRMLLRTIQFHARDDDEPSDFRTAPVVVELNLDGLPTEVEVADIPAGTYHKVSFRIHKPDDDEELSEDMADFRTGESGRERYSMIIEGTHGGTPFVYRSSKSMQQKIDLDPDLVVNDSLAGPLNVAMQVDVTEWFFDRNGNALDPADTSERNMNAIDRSIRESFRVFPDHDHDRHPDRDDCDDDDDDNDDDDNDDDDDDDDDADG